MILDEAIEKFKLLERMIEQDLPKFVAGRMAENAASMIEMRVRQTGKNAEGGMFKPYSRKPILTSGTTAKGKSIWEAMGSKETRKRGLQWVTIQHKGQNVHLFKLWGGYAQIRRLEGLQTDHKDFWFTSMMWRGFGVKRTKITPGEVIVTLGGKDQESQDKIDGNSAREGMSIIDISDSELKSLAEMLNKELERYINKLGLS